MSETITIQLPGGRYEPRCIEVPACDCPGCKGVGWTTEPDNRGDPAQVQCETCEGTGLVPIDFGEDNDRAYDISQGN